MTQIATLARDRADPTTAVAAAAMLTAVLVGVGLAVQIPLGLAILFGALYLPLIFVNLPVAVCAWIPLVFLEELPALNLASKVIGLLLALGWLGALLSGTASRAIFTRHRRLLEVYVILVVWLTLSIAWAPHTDQATRTAWQWWSVALVFLIVATSITYDRALVLAIGMYVVGAVVAVLVSASTGGPQSGDGGRLEAAVGDPNFLAAALISAVPLAFALMSVLRGTGWRILLLGVVFVLTVGVVATQSRGGMAAAAAMWVAAVIVLPRRRAVIAVGAVVAATAFVAFALNPASWERVTTQDPRGTGRVDIWTVAWEVFEDHPVRGVGLNNFGRVAPDYVREVGPLEEVDLVLQTPDRQVHSSYLQLLAENGIAALLLFLVVAAGCMRAALSAARIFARLGRPDLVAVSHGLFVGLVGLLASYVFISGSVDRRLWILLALCIAALEVASRAATPETGDGQRETGVRAASSLRARRTLAETLRRNRSPESSP